MRGRGIELCSQLPAHGSLSFRECKLFVNLLKAETEYLEYGSGASTIIAASIAKSVVSVEADTNWVQNTTKQLYTRGLMNVDVRFANIGPVGHLSIPRFRNASAFSYCTLPLKAHETFDLVFIDGRFRVACASHAYHRLNPHGTLIVHDYRHRSHYSDINRLYTLTGFVQSMAVFKRKPNRNPSPVFFKHRFDIQ